MHAFLLAVALLAPAAPPKNPVLAAARTRQEALRSVEFVLTVTESVMPAGAWLPSSRSDVPHPSPEEVYQWTARVLFDGDRWRIEDDRKPDGTRTKYRRVSVSDGTNRKEFKAPDAALSWKNAMCGVEVVASRDPPPAPEYAPLFLASRPLGVAGWRTLDLAQFVPNGENLTLEGAETEQWLVGDPKARSQTRLWADPMAGSAVRRLRVQPAGGPVATQTDISYAEHQSSGLWVPTWWWCVTFYADGNVNRTYGVTVDKTTVNATWPDSEFDITFPPGVRVEDTRDKTDYLVLPDGTLRKFEYSVDDQEPLPPLPAPPSQSWLMEYGPWVLAAVLVALVLVFLVARSRGRTPPAE